MALRGPRAIRPLMGEYGVYSSGVKLLPIRAAKLIHSLATKEQPVVVAVVIPVLLCEPFYFVVVIEIQTQNQLTLFHPFWTAMTPGGGKRKYPGARHTATAKIV